MSLRIGGVAADPRRRATRVERRRWYRGRRMSTAILGILFCSGSLARCSLPSPDECVPGAGSPGPVLGGLRHHRRRDDRRLRRRARRGCDCSTRVPGTCSSSASSAPSWVRRCSRSRPTRRLHCRVERRCCLAPVLGFDDRRRSAGNLLGPVPLVVAAGSASPWPGVGLGTLRGRHRPTVRRGPTRLTRWRLPGRQWTWITTQHKGRQHR